MTKRRISEWKSICGDSRREVPAHGCLLLLLLLYYYYYYLIVIVYLSIFDICLLFIFEVLCYYLTIIKWKRDDLLSGHLSLDLRFATHDRRISIGHSELYH